jgi:hypothetical protein
VLGLVAEEMFGVLVSGLYRMESGPVFTPGFGYGVDANGDGVFGNDPAFVDRNVAGVDQALQAWPCLRDSAGGFAERNSCRGDETHTLDLSLALRLPDFSGAATRLHLDAFDVLATSGNQPDAALYLLDPAADLMTQDGTVTVPLAFNPRFGQPLPVPHTGRKLRLGLSMSW